MTSRGAENAAFLVQNPDATCAAPNIVAAEETDDAQDTVPTSSFPTLTSNGSRKADFSIGTLHENPINPYLESDRAVANERHALDMQYQALTKGYTDADGTVLKEVDAQLEAMHDTYASYNASGPMSAALKEALARQDAKVTSCIERHAGGPPLLKDSGYSQPPRTEAEDFLRRMAELDAATKKAVDDNDKTVKF